MKKLISKILIASVIIWFTPISATFASFSDLQESHKNYDAIIYLQEHGIINGYPDNTFKPDNPVNRSEFLKIIIEGSNIDLNVTRETPFPDVNHSAWYSPYLKKAYAEGWITGYPDGTFKPEQTINKVEALKVLGKVQNWQLPTNIDEKSFNDVVIDEWYSPYITYAKEHNLLEETNLFFPAMLMTRAKISEVIYRTEQQSGVSETSGAPNEQSEVSVANGAPNEDEDPEPQLLNFTPVTYQTAPKTFFPNITLNSAMPNTFYKNEVYILEGTITSGNYDVITAILEGEDNSEYYTFSEEIDSSNFEMSIYFKNSGNYNLGLLPGESGEVKAAKISVLPSLPENSNTLPTPQKPSSLNINFSNNQTYATFSPSSATIKKLEFTQNNEKITYLSRQNITKIPVRYSDFENFSLGNVAYTVKFARLSSSIPLKIGSSFVESPSKTFQALEHSFSSIEEDQITINPFETQKSTNEFSITATLKADSLETAYITKVDGFVEEIPLSGAGETETYFGSTIIKNGGVVTLTYDPPTEGKYILEINNKFGEPILNHPVYIGSGIPLIPDFFDINQRNFFESSVNLNNLRNELLALINDSREDHDLNPIELSSEINEIAQAHSDDMADNNFFAHVNLDNKTPDDRRLDAGIATPISENIAKDISIEFAHYGLMRSGSHRSNILNPNWERIGIGISEDEGYLYVAEEFSTLELTEGDLENFGTELFNGINTLRTDNSKDSISRNGNLDTVSQYLNDQAIDYDVALTNEIFLDALDLYAIVGTSQALGRTSNIWKEILNSFRTEEEDNLTDPLWQSIGIDIQTDNIGSINTILILNNQP